METPETDVTKMTEVELKALWLDQLLEAERIQGNILTLRKELEKRKNDKK